MHGKYALSFALFVFLLGIAAFSLTIPAQAAATTWTVSIGNSGACTVADPNCATIQAALNAAALAGHTSGDTIEIHPGTYNEAPKVRIGVTLKGVGSPAPIVDGTGLNDSVITTPFPTTTVTIIGLVIENGDNVDHGGGIRNQGVMTVISSTIRNNTANGATTGGGGIYTSLALTLTDSSVISNTAATTTTAFSSQGGGIYNTLGGKVWIFNSTISGNKADKQGGGIFSTGYDAAELYLNNVTITNNDANVTSSLGDGGGLNVISGTVTMKNTIIAGNHEVNSYHPAGVDCSLHMGILTSEGYNVIGIGGDQQQCIFIQQPTDHVGSEASPLNAQLGPLADNGGPTLTHALLSGSPAIDTGSSTDSFGNAVTIDQRGISRPQGLGWDIGAFELEFSGIIYKLYLPFISK